MIHETPDEVLARIAALTARVSELEEISEAELARKNGPKPKRTRTLYVREEDQAVWDEAKTVIGESLSTCITNYLKQLVVERKAARK